MAPSLSARCSSLQLAALRRCSQIQLSQTRLPSRGIHLKTQRKRDEAAKKWDERAEAIARGEQRNLWDILEERGFFKDIAG